MKVFEFEEHQKTKKLEELRTEKNIVAELCLDGIPKIYELVETAEWNTSKGEKRIISYMLMELIEGVELFDFIE